MNIILTVEPQICLQLFETLRQCKAHFRFSNKDVQFDILDVERFRYITEQSGGIQLYITFNILNNHTTNMVLIAMANVKEFEICGSKE